MRPAMEHRDPVADAEELGEIGADEEEGLSFRGEAVHPLVDLGFAQDVDAARRLVEKEDVGFLVEEPGQGDFLLVPAGKPGRGLVRVAGLDVRAPPSSRRPPEPCGAWRGSRSGDTGGSG